MPRMSQQPASYHAVSKLLHWAIALMIIVQIPAGMFMSQMDFSQTKFTMYQLHKSFGFIVLGLSLFRLYWRLTHPIPALPDNTAGWKAAAAKLTHVGFYVVIIGIPLTGWLMVSASPLEIPTKIFFAIPVPHWPVPISEASEGLFRLSHELLAKATIALLVLHVGAALNHHFREKDDVLIRMLPSFLGGKS